MKNLKSHTVFFILAMGGILILFIFTYLTNRTLNSDNLAAEKVSRFYHFNKNLTLGTFIHYFILLFTANIMYIRQRYWDTFIWAGLIFSTYTIIDWWWLGEKLFHYKKANGLWLGESNLMPFVGVMLALFGLVIAIGNYFLLKRFVKEKNILPVEDDLEDSIDKQD